MWRHTHLVTTDVSAEALWGVATDFPYWPAWQPGVVSARLAADGRSLLVTRNGVPARVTIDEVRAPSRLVLTASFFLARMRTDYDFSPGRGGTRLRVTVDLAGPLAWLYALTHGGWLRCWVPVMVIGLIRKARRGANRSAPVPPEEGAALTRTDVDSSADTARVAAWSD